jgi:hypothetical protein
MILRTRASSNSSDTCRVQLQEFVHCPHDSEAVAPRLDRPVYGTIVQITAGNL